MTDTSISFRCTRQQLLGAAEAHLNIRRAEVLYSAAATAVVKHLIATLQLTAIDGPAVSCVSNPGSQGFRDAGYFETVVTLRRSQEGSHAAFLQNVKTLQDAIMPV